MRVITVEREYGSRGGEFAYLLAQHLGWRLIDNCLVDEIAHQTGLTAGMVAGCDERFDPWYYRLGRNFWHGSVERLPAIMSSSEVFDSERMNTLVRSYLKERVEEGHCVVVGRGAAAALRGTPSVFNLFVYAAMSRKLEWFRDRFPDRAEDAEAELTATDRRRAAYIRRYYAQEWNDYHLYQLMLNSCMGFDAMLAATLEAAGLQRPQPAQ
jgi:hypothetical protein